MTETEFRSRLEEEIPHWQHEQLITEAQGAAILARYGVVEGDQRRGRLAVVLGFLGALLVGVGVIVLFAANWQEIPGWTKLALIFAAVAAANGAGYWLRYEKRTFQGTGDALLFLGALLFGAAIFLIAQGFHVNANEPVLLLLWAVGVLPMAYLLSSRAMLALVVINLTIALGWETAFWLEETNRTLPYLAVYLVFGVLLYALGRLHGAFPTTKLHERPYGELGLFFILGSVFPLTFGFMNDSHWGATYGQPAGAVVRFVLLLAAAGAASLANLLLRRRPSPTTFPEIAVLIVLLVGGGFLFFVEGGMGAAGALLFNLVLFALIVGTISVGYWNREPAWVNLGTFFFALQVISRYFDWFWSLMPRSLFFISAGLLLLFGGMALERTRRRVVEELREEGGER